MSVSKQQILDYIDKHYKPSVLRRIKVHPSIYQLEQILKKMPNGPLTPEQKHLIYTNIQELIEKYGVKGEVQACLIGLIVCNTKIVVYSL